MIQIDIYLLVKSISWHLEFNFSSLGLPTEIDKFLVTSTGHARENTLRQALYPKRYCAQKPLQVLLNEDWFSGVQGKPETLLPGGPDTASLRTTLNNTTWNTSTTRCKKKKKKSRN